MIATLHVCRWRIPMTLPMCNCHGKSARCVRCSCVIQVCPAHLIFIPHTCESKSQSRSVWGLHFMALNAAKRRTLEMFSFTASDCVCFTRNIIFLLFAMYVMIAVRNGIVSGMCDLAMAFQFVLCRSLTVCGTMRAHARMHM